MLDLDAGKYGFYVWTAYGVTAVVLIVLVAASLRHAARWRKKAKELGWGK